MRVAVLGVGIDAVLGEQVLAALGEETAEPEACRRIVTANTELVMMAQSDGALAEAVGTADWVLAESVGIMWAGALGGTPFPEQLPGIEFAERLAAAAARLEPVSEVLHLTGAPDYQLRVSCRDTAELDMLLRTLRNRLGAADTETTIILRSGPAQT